MKRKINFIFISFMIMLLTPLNIYAGNSQICSKTGSISGYTEGKGDTGYDYIYLGENIQEPIKWRVLSENGNAEGSTDFLKDDDGKQVDNKSVIFILTESFLCTSADACQAPNYQDSVIKQWCDSVINDQNNDIKFSLLEKNALLKTEKDDIEVIISDTKSCPYVNRELNGDKMFFLSASEVLDGKYGFAEKESRIVKYNEKATAWILRQAPGVDEDFLADKYTASVSTTGTISFGNKKSVGYRPAANLNKENIEFSSAAEGGKGEFGIVEENTTHEWKLTLKDDNSFADGASIDLTTIAPGKEATITHKKLSELSADYTNVTAAISDKDGNLLYYGSVDTNVDATETKITIPADLPEASYTLSVYGEDWNGDKFTDYATGTPFETELVVDSKAEEATTEPTTESSTEPATEPTTPAAKVGTAVTVGNLKYKITSVKANNPTVTITGMKNKKKTSVKIPATIKNKNVTYKVTAIANNAFKGNKKLKSVTIGKNVKSLGKNVFRGCKKLKKITVKTKVLKKVGANSLKGIHKKAVIKVPAKKKKAYKKLFKKKGQAKTVKIK